MNRNPTELQCILCAKNSSDGQEHIITEEHIIPKCLGGWITLPFLCKKCNNEVLGRAAEGMLKQNAYIVTAIDKLRLQTPDKAYNRANISIDFDNEIKARGKFTENRGVELIPTKQPDGSIIIPEKDTKAILAKQIERYERDKNVTIPYNNGFYDSAPSDTRVIISGTEITFIKLKKMKGSTLISNLNKPIPFLTPMSIAFENIAGFSYPFAVQPAFDPLRDWILNDNLENKVLILNPIHPSQTPDMFHYEPYHYLRYSMVEDGFVSLIVLFNQLAFSVFMGFNPDLDLLPDLKLLDKYIFYDLKNRKLQCYIPPQSIFDKDTQSLEAVYHLANYELRLKK